MIFDSSGFYYVKEKILIAMFRKETPNIFRIIRAPFLSLIVVPVIVGTIASVLITGSFLFINFIIVFVMGIFLHIATNVYNDIYDTFQGTDKVNVHRNEFSGGSGILVNFPELLPKMYLIARFSLVIAGIAAILLLFSIDENLYVYLIGLYVLSVFFSKYYTAEPVNLASRGLGEFFVWFAFGPMAILVASVSQNLGFHPTIIFLMPITGLNALSILWLGELIDLDADKETGKLVVVSRIGTKKASSVYPLIHALIMLNIIIVPLVSEFINFFIYLALIPYLVLLPKILSTVFVYHYDAERLKPVAKLNVFLHLTFSLSLIAGLLIQLLI